MGLICLPYLIVIIILSGLKQQAYPTTRTPASAPVCPRTSAAKKLGELRVPVVAVPSGDGVANLRRRQRGWRRLPARLMEGIERQIVGRPTYTSPVTQDEVLFCVIFTIFFFFPYLSRGYLFVR